jgi:hypothetical protein
MNILAMWLIGDVDKYTWLITYIKHFAMWWITHVAK